MSADCNHGYKLNTPLARRANLPLIKHSYQNSMLELKKIFADYNPERLDIIEKIDLTNYYTHNREAKIIHCSLCNINIRDKDTFRHTVSSQHECNRRFYNFVQKRIQKGNLHFIVLNRNWVQCRYCDNRRMTNNSFERTTHSQTAMHVERMAYCTDRVTKECYTFIVQQHAEHAAKLHENNLSQIVKENWIENGFRVSNERQFRAGPSREANMIRREVTSQEPNRQSRTYRYKIDDSDHRYYRNVSVPNNHSRYSLHTTIPGYSPTPSTVTQKDEPIPIWLVIMGLTLVAYYWLHKS